MGIQHGRSKTTKYMYVQNKKQTKINKQT